MVTSTLLKKEFEGMKELFYMTEVAGARLSMATETVRTSEDGYVAIYE